MKLDFTCRLLKTAPFFLFLFWVPVTTAAPLTKGQTTQSNIGASDKEQSKPKEKPSEDQPQADSDDSRNFSWIVLPGPFSTKETGFGIGGLAAVSFYPEPEPSQSNPISISLAAAYTIKNQFTIGLQSEIYWNDNEYAIVAEETFKDWVDRYYGIGNRTPAVYQKYAENVIESEIEFRREHFENFYLGVIHSIYSVLDFQPEDVRDDDGERYPDRSPLLHEEVLGVGENLTHGLGLTILYDHRDDIDYPFSGGYYYSCLMGYSKYLGGDYNYIKWTVDLRRYLRIVKGYRHLVALQLFHEANFGEPPFYHLAELGGPKLMRGYYQGRFRDRHMLVLQTEYRFPIYWRFNGALFGSLGEVYGQSRFALSEVQASGGAGIVFRFGDNIYIRFDFGIGFEGYAIILQPKNAF